LRHFRKRTPRSQPTQLCWRASIAARAKKKPPERSGPRGAKDSALVPGAIGQPSARASCSSHQPGLFADPPGFRRSRQPPCWRFAPRSAETHLACAPDADSATWFALTDTARPHLSEKTRNETRPCEIPASAKPYDDCRIDEAGEYVIDRSGSRAFFGAMLRTWRKLNGGRRRRKPAAAGSAVGLVTERNASYREIESFIIGRQSDCCS
jgi:hypothetical protein